MMSKYGIDVPKVGIGGDIEDVSCFIADQAIFEGKVELIEGDITEYALTQILKYMMMNGGNLVKKCQKVTKSSVLLV